MNSISQLLNKSLNFLVGLIFIIFLIINTGVYLELPIQHFDWIASYIDAYLPDHKSFLGMKDAVDTLSYQLTNPRWLFRPSAAFFYHLNLIVNGANPYFLSIIKILFLMLLALLVYRISKDRNLDSVHVWFLMALVFFLPSQPLLMSYSSEIQMISIIFAGLIIIQRSLEKESLIGLSLAVILISIGSGFKELGLIFLISSIFLLILVIAGNVFSKKFSNGLIAGIAILIVVAGLEFFWLSKNVTRSGLFDVTKFLDNLAYSLPFQSNSILGKVLISFFIIVVIDGFKEILCKLNLRAGSYRFFLENYFVLTLLFSGVVGLMVLSINTEYPPRASPRYLYPISIALFVPLVIFSKISNYLKALKLEFLAYLFLLCLIIHGGMVQFNRAKSFQYEELAFRSLLDISAYQSFNGECTFFIDSKNLSYSETEETLHHIFGLRGKMLGLNLSTSIRNYDNEPLDFCNDYYLVTTRGIGELTSGSIPIFNLDKLRSIYEMHSSKVFGRTASFFDPIPYWESGTLPKGNVAPFRIYKFSNQIGKLGKNLNAELTADNQWHNLVFDDSREKACFFIILNTREKHHDNFRILHKNGVMEEYFKEINSINYSYEPRAICNVDTSRVEYKIKTFNDYSKLKILIVPASRSAIKEVTF
jgi:hypothetical protein